MNADITLICTPLKFYSATDEELFCQWLEAIDCIEEFKGVGDELHLHILFNPITDADLKELVGLFKRYNFDQTQLEVFMTESNKDLFK